MSHRFKQVSAFILLLLVAGPHCVASVWYASPDGKDSAGSYSQPWGVAFAVSRANSLLKPGDTVIFKAGTYDVPTTNNVLVFEKPGLPGAKITYKSENPWGFSIDGGVQLPTTVSNIILHGIRVFSSNTTNRVNTDYNLYPPGIEEFGEGNEILHNLVENCGHPAISSWKSTHGKRIMGNILRFAGYKDMNGAWQGGNRGNGMYLQNADDSQEALVRGNISYHQLTTGMKAYGNTDIWGFKFLNNIVVDCGEGGIFYHQDNYGSKGVQIISNYVWGSHPGIRLGYPLGNGGHSNAVVVGNYVAEYETPFYVVDGWANISWSNNVGVNLLHKYVWLLEDNGETNGNIKSHQFNKNAYWAKDYSPYHGEPFSIKAQPHSFENWKSTLAGESESTFSFGDPGKVEVFAFNPSFDKDFVHVAVFNWLTNATANVDLANFFKSGDKLRIYDAQNLPRAYTNFVYDGGNVSLNLNLTNRVEMLGSFSSAASAWPGFDARFRAFVIHRFGSDSVQAPIMRNARPL